MVGGGADGRLLFERRLPQKVILVFRLKTPNQPNPLVKTFFAKGNSIENALGSWWVSRQVTGKVIL